MTEDGFQISLTSGYAIEGEQLKVLNTDSFFASRVLQVTKKLDRTQRVFEPGRYTYFQGTITIDEVNNE